MNTTPVPVDVEGESRSRAEVERRYRQTLESLELEIGTLSFRSGWMAIVRGLLLLATFGLLVVGWFQFGSIWWLPGSIAGCLFVAIAAIHEHGDRQLKNAQTLRAMEKHSLAAKDRKWRSMANVPIESPSSRRSVAEDLDLIGPTSLFRLLCHARTPFGIVTLRDWLLLTPKRAEVLDRQVAVKQLAPLTNWRRALQLHSEQLASSQTGPSALIEWAEEKPWLGNRRYLIWIARCLAALVLVMLVMLGFGLIDKQLGGTVIVVACAFNFAMTVMFAGTIHMIFNQVSSRHGDVAHYRKLFKLLDEMPGDGECLASIHQEASFGGRMAFHQIEVLGRIMQIANLRRAGFFGVVYLILQFLFLWDFHALDLLERWQARCGASVRKWFKALGKVEALGCLAKLAHDEPDWVYPEIHEYDMTASQFSSVALGHPLLSKDDRVCNDVSVGPSGSLLLVTGSNMSGKSTLLRSIGVNISLAQAGTVVCADSLSMPIFHVETSMRISDSLSEGVSFFMAELKRLKEVVDLAGGSHLQNDHGFFYLLDEILQGTNSRERHIAVQEVIKHLVRKQAIGAVSTHDLELASAEGVGDLCHAVHFRESIETQGDRQMMTFDYLLREGVATTSNALKLLQMVGLGDAAPIAIQATSVHRSENEEKS